MLAERIPPLHEPAGTECCFLGTNASSRPVLGLIPGLFCSETRSHVAKASLVSTRDQLWRCPFLPHRMAPFPLLPESLITVLGCHWFPFLTAKVSPCEPGWPGARCIDQAALDLVPTLLPHPPKCRDDRHELPCPALLRF